MLAPSPRRLWTALSAALIFAPLAAVAAPTTDQNLGIWTDLYADNAGIASNIPETFGIRHDPFARLVTLADGAPTECREDPCGATEAPGRYGQMATLPIAPVSFDGWRTAYVKFTASQASDVELRFLADNGTVYGPFTFMESDDAAFSAMVDLQEAGKAVPASVGSGRLLFHMRERVVVQGAPDGPNGPIGGDPADVRIRPTLQGLRATWTPRSVVHVAVEAPATTCANAAYTARVRVAVSLVRAEDLVVWAPLTAPAADTFGRTYPLSFRGASNGGLYTASAINVAGTEVPANSVYWNLGGVDAGNTFVVSYNVAPPVGTLNATTYTTTAEARASNADGATAPTPVQTATSSSPAPVVRKTPGNSYLINNQWFIDGGQTLSYNLFIANYEIVPQGNTCTEAYHRTVVYDDVSDLITPATGDFGSVFTGTPPSAFTISDGGQFTATAITVNGVDVPANSIYWDLGAMEVGARRNLSFSLNLQADTEHGGPLPLNHRIRNSGHIRSGHQTQLSNSTVDVFIGIPNTPSGTYAKGDRIRGSGGISAANNDNRFSSVGYGDPITFLLYARNNGASQLANTVFVDKVPADTTFSSAFLPSNAYGAVYYNTGGGSNAVDTPPDFTVSTGAFGPSWTTTPPADPSTVKWVGFTVPRLASPYFPVRVDPDDENSPFLTNSATAEFTVTVNQPEDGCPLLTINNRGLFNTYGYVGVGQTQVTPIEGVTDWRYQDNEPVQVKPLVPSFEFMSVGASPTSLINSGNVSFTVNVPNRLSGGVETDTALDAVVTLTMPRMSLNGVLTHVPFVSVSAPGGSVDLTQLPERIVVSYPSIAPDQTRSITATVNVPSGFVSGQSIGLSANATARDDICGPISGGGSRSVVVTGNPYLTVAKRATLGVAARGAEIEFVMSYTNIGDAVSTKTWIVDQIPAYSEWAWSQAVPNGGQVWFSNKSNPLLPQNLRSDSPTFSDTLIRQNFVQGQNGGDGRVYPPSNFSGQPTWIAFLVDNASLNPPQFPSSGLSTVRWGVTVQEDADVGDIVRNEAAILSSELLPAISNETATIVSDDPSLDVLRDCPDVVAAGDTVTYRFHWVNNSTNDDYNVRFIESLPPFVEFVSATHTWNETALSRFSGIDVQPTVDLIANTVTWDVSRAIDEDGQTPIESFEGGEFAVTVRVAADTESGTFADIGGLALATDFTGELALSLATGCRVLVENADIFIRISVSESAPVSGETVTYTATVSNEGANVAANTTVSVTLPTGVTYVPGSVIVTTPGWSFAGAPTVTTAGGQQTLTWSTADNNAIRQTGGTAGTLPGRSGDINIAIAATVGATVPPETTLTATAETSTTSGEDANYPNEAEVTAVTPLADPWVLKTGPGFAQPGAAITYRLRYGNESRQAAGSVFLVDRLWDAVPADGNADITLIGITANNGETIYYNAAPLTGAAPAFDPADPAATGWTTSATAGNVNWIGFHRPSLAGSAGPFSIFIDAALRAPGTGREPQAGATIPNVASIDFTDPNAKDQDDANNTSTVETRTPGVDIAAGLVCTPEGAFPGATPGQDAVVTLELRNNGTVTAYGLKLAWAPGDWFTVGSDDAAQVVVETTAGGESSAVDENNTPITATLNWTRVGSEYVLGSADASSPVWYRKVGLPAGTRVRITVQGQVGGDIVSGTQVQHDLTVTTDYRFDFDPDGGEVEEIVDNNAAMCTTTVFRADPMVIKTASAARGDEPYTAGDRIAYDIQYNNIGAASAHEVFIEDYLPADTGFVVGSLSNLPEGAEIRYDDGTGSFSYAPTTAVGTVDSGVKAFRVTWTQPLPAPAGATFRQETRTDFAAGTFDGTAVSADGESIIVTGRSGGNRGTYTTPPIPTDDTASVVEWGRIVVNSRVGAEGASVTVTVVDADSGDTIATGITPDASGAIDLEIDPTRHQRIQLRAELIGQGVECSATSANILPIPMEFQRGPYHYVTDCDPGRGLVGAMDEGEKLSRGLVWEKDGEGDYTADTLPSAFVRDFPEFFLDSDTIVGRAYDESWNFGRLAVWTRTPLGWEALELPDIIVPPETIGHEVEVAEGTSVFLLFAYNPEASIVAGAFYRDPAGEWRFDVIPEIEGQTCDGAQAAGSRAFIRCRDVQDIYSFYVFQPGQPEETALQPLPSPPGVGSNGNLWMSAAYDETLLGVSADTNNFRRSFIYEFQDTDWVVSALANDMPPGVTQFYSDVQMFGSRDHAMLYSQYYLENRWYYPALLATRTPEGWTAQAAPLPEGYVIGQNVNQSYPRGYLPGMGYIVQMWGNVNDAYFLHPDATGQWQATLLDRPEGVSQVEANSLTSAGYVGGQVSFSGDNSWTAALWEIDGNAADGFDIILRVGENRNRNRNFAGVWPGVSHADYIRRTSCDVSLMNGNGATYTVAESDFTDTTFTAVQLPLPPDTAFTSQGSIQHAFGAGYAGYNQTNDGSEAVLFVPDAEAGLKAYTLERPDADNFNQAQIQWVSPDFKHAAGYGYRTIEGQNPTVAIYWEYDESLDKYLVKPLLGGNDPEGRGQVYNDSYNNVHRYMSPYFLRGRSRYDDGNERSGVWAYTPSKPTPFTWIANITPNPVPDNSYAYAYHGTENGTALNYNYLDENGWQRSRWVIAEVDPSSESGVLLTDFPLPEGADPLNMNFSGYPVRSDFIVGSVYIPSAGQQIGMVWRKEGDAWRGYRMTESTYSYPYFASRRTFGPAQLPMVYGGFSGESSNTQVMVPNGESDGVAYEFPAFELPEGVSRFVPYNFDGSPWSGSYYASPFHEGFIPGAFQKGERYVSGYYFLEDDLSWSHGELPGIEADDAEQLYVRFAAPGPVLYGESYFSGRNRRLVAWYFPDGDMSNPVVVDLGAEFGTYSYFDGNEMIERERDCWYNNYSFSKPGDNGYSRVALYCDGNNGSVTAVVNPSSEGFSVVITEPSRRGGNAIASPESDIIALFWGNEPSIIGCSRGGGVAIDATQVLFRTNVNPSFGYEVEIPDVCQASVTNTASIFTGSPQVTTSNDRSTVTSDIETVDVEVRIEADRGTVEVDEDINYTVTVVNNGPGPARDIRLELYLPDGEGGDEPRLVRRNVGTLAAGGSWSYEDSVYVSTDEPFLPLNAAASITTSSIECDDANNADTVSVLTGSLPNVTVDLSGPPTWAVGSEATYVATVINDGNSTASGVVLTVQLPAYGDVASVTLEGGDWEVPPECAQAGLVLTCALGSMTPISREGSPIVVTVVMDSPTCEEIEARANVGATVEAQLDANVSDNSDSLSTAITPPPGRLTVMGVPSRSTVEQGDSLTYFFHYANTGTAAVEGVTLEASIPAGTTLRMDGTTAGYTANGDTVTWSLPALAAGRSGIAALAVTVDAAAPAVLGGTVALRVDEGANACDVSASFGGAAVTAPGIHVTKRASASVGCGEQVDWLITVTNTAAAEVRNLVVTDAVPAQSPYVTGTIRGPGASAAGNPVLSWTIPAIPAGQAVTLGFRSQAPASSGNLVSNRAVVEQGGNALATSAPAVVRATCNGAALRVAKAWGAGCAVEGQTIEVTVTTTNTTQQALLTPAIADPLPDGFTFVGSSTGAVYDAETGLITQGADSILGGQTLTMRYTATVSGASGTVVLEAATATAGGVQPQASNPVSSVVLNCNDNDPCTTDSCELFVGCVNTLTPIPGVSDDDCDGVDDNCNAETDEDWVVVDTSCGVGVCAREGQLVCPTGATAPQDTCEEGEPTAANDTLCNGLDDDCDESVDEDYVSFAYVCGAPCDGTAPTSCSEGKETWDCEAAPATVAGLSCDDGNACSNASTCDGASNCVGRTFISCNDDNACTSDTCDRDAGCLYEPLSGTPCSDANLCTEGDLCVEGVCQGDLIPCPEGDACEGEGVCNPATGVCDYPILPGDLPVPVSLTDLGTLGGETSRANAVNAMGMAVGVADTSAGQRHAFAWTADGGMVDLTPLAASAEATAVNDAGLVVGVMTLPDGGATSAFAWTASGTLASLFSGEDAEVLPPNAAGQVAGHAAGMAYLSEDGQSAATALLLPEGGTGAEVLDLSEGGHVVGRYTSAAGQTRAFWYSQATGVVDVTALAEGEAVAVNTAGQAVGMAMADDGIRKAYLFGADGNHTALGTLGGDESWAVAINDAGVVVGLAQTAGGMTHGFVWTAATGMRDLGSLGGDSRALFLNQAGMIAGQSDTVFGTSPAVVWMPDDSMVSLDLVGAVRARPVGLTDTGLVAGVLETAAGERAFIWDLARGTEDLGTLGGLAARAVAVSAMGQVAGEAESGEGAMRAFVSSVPETACIVCDEDNDPPVIHCPQVRQAIECNFGGVGVDFGQPSVSDACGRPVEVSSDAPETYEVGPTVVTYTATDSEGNSAACTTTVIVEDTTPPVLTCPESLEVEADEGVCGASVTLPVTATDGCDGDDVVIYGPNGEIGNAASLAPGLNEVSVTAVDNAGNTASCSFVVNVVNVSTLVIDCEEDLTVEAPADFCGYPEAISADVLDGCGTELTVESASESFPVGVTDVDFTAANPVGEEAACTTRLTVVDVTPPTIDCGTAGDLQALPAVFSPTASDVCGVTTTVTNARCLVVDADGNATEVTEGCDIEVQADNALVVRAVPVYIDGVAVPVEAIAIAWDVSATDPSGNTSTESCEADLDLSARDRDGDGVIDTDDNCPDTPNADQLDSDLDGMGDVCDDTPYDGLVAQGNGCQGGNGEKSGIIALLLAAVFLAARRMRAARHR